MPASESGERGSDSPVLRHLGLTGINPKDRNASSQPLTTNSAISDTQFGHAVRRLIKRQQDPEQELPGTP